MNGEPVSAGISRRTFLGTAASAAALTLPVRLTSAPAEVRGPLVDVNVSLFRWPTRRLPGDETPALLDRLHAHGVTQAWAGSFEALLHKDLRAVNTRLARECRKHGGRMLLPFGAINPKLPDWEDELRRCVEVNNMPGIRLHPNFHGYKLNDPDFAQLLRRARDLRLIVQIAFVMEDERTVHPRLSLQPIDAAPLAELVRQTPALKLVLLNVLRTWRREQLRELLSAGEVFVEIAMLEGVAGIARLLEEVSAERVLFGSHAPFYYFESAWLKLKESPLTDEQLSLIREKNAGRVLGQRAMRQQRGA